MYFPLFHMCRLALTESPYNTDGRTNKPTKQPSNQKPSHEETNQATKKPRKKANKQATNQPAARQGATKQHKQHLQANTIKTRPNRRTYHFMSASNVFVPRFRSFY